MASVHKPHGTPYWYCQYCNSSGKWVKKSTRLKDQKQAKIWCDSLQQAENQIGRGRASEKQLRRLIDATMTKITGRSIALPTVREWFRQWLSGKEGGSAPRTIVRYKQSVANFLEFLGKRADDPIDTINQTDIVAFRQYLRDEGRAAPTINLVIGRILGSAFRLAHAQGLVERNPLAGLPRLTERGLKRKGTFTLEQVRQLLAVADNEWRGVIIAGFTTGARLSDIVNLRWEDIDRGDDMIVFLQAKTQTQMVAAIHPDMQQWFNEQKDHPAEGPIFPGLTGRYSGGRSGLSGAFARLMDKAGIQSDKIRDRHGKEGRSVRSLSFHSFRHGAASAIFKSKVIETAQKHITGHTRGQTLRTYTHHDVEAIKAASSLIPRIL